MSEIQNRLPENVPGAWYVDDTCIICGLCGDRAPTVFRMNPGGNSYYVFNQPANADELEAAEEARDSCPMDAIGNDGGA